MRVLTSTELDQTAGGLNLGILDTANEKAKGLGVDFVVANVVVNLCTYYIIKAINAAQSINAPTHDKTYPDEP